jgi:hypothetical protein
VKIRRAVTALVLAAAPLGLAAAPAQAWECQKNEVCQQAVMTACMTIYRVTGEPNCH